MAGVSHGTVSNVLNGRGTSASRKSTRSWTPPDSLTINPMRRRGSCGPGKARELPWCCPISLPSATVLLYRHYSGAIAAGRGGLYLTDDREQNERRILQMLAAKQYRLVVSVSCPRLPTITICWGRMGPRSSLFIANPKAQSASCRRISYRLPMTLRKSSRFLPQVESACSAKSADIRMPSNLRLRCKRVWRFCALKAR